MHDGAIAATLPLGEAAQRRWDAVIVGAGPAGGVAAIVLSRLGHRVLLVDRATFPRDKVCGCCLGPAAVATLHELGLSNLLAGDRSAPMDRFDLRTARRRLQTPMRGGRVISRYRLDATLVRAARDAGAAFLPHCRASIGPPSDMYRSMQLISDEQRVECQARVIIAAGGLGFGIDGPGHHDEPCERLWRRSRLGGSTIIAGDGCDLPTGTVRMIVARRGYVGLARVEDDRLAVGGAFDVALVREAGGLAGAAMQVLTDADHVVPGELASAHWLGAPQLTRRPVRVAAPRLLAVGDAAGFVEPFTGEGMTWAIQSARAAATLVAPFLAARHLQWNASIEDAWSHAHRRLVQPRQRRCQLIAHVLRRPTALACCMAAGRLLPRAARVVVEHIHAPGAAWSALPPLNPSGGTA